MSAVGQPGMQGGTSGYAVAGRRSACTAPDVVMPHPMRTLTVLFMSLLAAVGCQRGPVPSTRPQQTATVPANAPMPEPDRDGKELVLKTAGTDSTETFDLDPSDPDYVVDGVYVNRVINMDCIPRTSGIDAE